MTRTRSSSDILRGCLAGRCDRELVHLAYRAGVAADRVLQFVEEPEVELTAEEKQRLGAVALVGKYLIKREEMRYEDFS